MKNVFVVIDAKTGDFFVPNGYSSRGRKRKIQAYISELKAEAAMNMFHPRPRPEDYIIKRYVPGVELR